MNDNAAAAELAPSPSMPDLVRLRGMQFYAYHGATPQERQIGQRFEVDVEFTVDTEKVDDGDLSTTLDYRLIYEVCRRCCVERQYKFIEVVAREIVREVLAQYPLTGIRVTVRKPSVPLGGVITVGAEAVVSRGVL